MQEGLGLHGTCCVSLTPGHPLENWPHCFTSGKLSAVEFRFLKQCHAAQVSLRLTR